MSVLSVLEGSQRVAVNGGPDSLAFAEVRPAQEHITPLMLYCQVLYSGNDPKIIARV
jgi:hypothetical protein